jgi:hypothetical protein
MVKNGVYTEGSLWVTKLILKTRNTQRYFSQIANFRLKYA